MSESADLPAPPVPADLRLRGFRYFQLDTQALLASKLVAKSTPAGCWAALMLWIAAMRQTPAGSLPNDDTVLRGFARVLPHQWRRVRLQALHGWYKCSDGRLYHEVVTDQVLVKKRMQAIDKTRKTRSPYSSYTSNQEVTTKFRVPKHGNDKDIGGTSPSTKLVSISNLPTDAESACAKSAPAGGRRDIRERQRQQPAVPFIERWWTDEAKTREMAIVLEVPHKRGESWADWRHRIFDRIKALTGES